MKKEELVDVCNRFDGREKEFKQIVWHFILLVSNQEWHEFTSQLGIMPGSFSRWGTGVCSPHIEVRKAVVKKIKKILLSQK